MSARAISARHGAKSPDFAADMAAVACARRRAPLRVRELLARGLRAGVDLALEHGGGAVVIARGEQTVARTPEPRAGADADDAGGALVQAAAVDRRGAAQGSHTSDSSQVVLLDLLVEVRAHHLQPLGGALDVPVVLEELALEEELLGARP